VADFVSQHEKRPSEDGSSPKRWSHGTDALPPAHAQRLTVWHRNRAQHHYPFCRVGSLRRSQASTLLPLSAIILSCSATDIFRIRAIYATVVLLLLLLPFLLGERSSCPTTTFWPTSSTLHHSVTDRGRMHRPPLHECTPHTLYASHRTFLSPRTHSAGA